MAYKIFKLSIAFMLTVALIATVPRKTSGESKYAGEFLNVDVCADNAATGGAFSTIMDNASVMFYNPAGLSNINKTSVSLMRMEDIVGTVGTDLGMASNFIGINSKIKNFMVGVNYFATTVDGIMDTRNLLFDDINSDGIRQEGERVFYNSELISIGSDRESVAIIGCSHNITNSLAIGINAKNISQSVFEFESVGVGIDAGIFYKLGDDGNLKLGVCIQDIGDTGIDWHRGYKDYIPQSVLTCISYGIPGVHIAGMINTKYGLNLAGGIEIKIADTLAIRGGIKQIAGASEELTLTSYSMGIGLNFGKNMNVDYALVGMGENSLGQMNKISMSMR